MRGLYIVAAAAIALADQLTKWVVLERFSPDTVVQVIPGLFSLVRVENRGVAFGLFSGMSSAAGFAIIVAMSVTALGVICYLLWKTAPGARRAGLALALILGGATGNLIDRIIRGRVVDFLDFYVRAYHWPAFNLADSAIVIGAALLLFELFFDRRPNPVTG
jgi:signal peptidase II